MTGKEGTSDDKKTAKAAVMEEAIKNNKQAQGVWVLYNKIVGPLEEYRYDLLTGLHNGTSAPLQRGRVLFRKLKPLISEFRNATLELQKKNQKN